MKTRNYFIFLGVVGILSVCAFGEIESPPRSDLLTLIGQANPALEGIEEVLVIIVPADGTKEKDGLVWKQLESRVRDKLKEAGLKAVLKKSGDVSSIPELRIYVEMLKFSKSDIYVFRTETTVATESRLKDRNLYFKAEVWWSKAAMAGVSVSRMPEAVTKTIEGQVEEFISAWNVANQPGISADGANEVKMVSLPIEKSEAEVRDESEAKEYKYAASEKSRVFHKADCSSVRRIKADNLVGYRSRDEALRAGKRPCKRCKP